jgi:hypothetical protein
VQIKEPVKLTHAAAAVGGGVRANVQAGRVEAAGRTDARMTEAPDGAEVEVVRAALEETIALHAQAAREPRRRSWRRPR